MCYDEDLSETFRDAYGKDAENFQKITQSVQDKAAVQAAQVVLDEQVVFEGSSLFDEQAETDADSVERGGMYLTTAANEALYVWMPKDVQNVLVLELAKTGFVDLSAYDFEWGE